MVEKQLSDALNRAARMGQRGDTEVGHLTPREVVIPIAVQKRFPEAMRALRGMFTEAGLNYEQYVVGNKANKIHARTGKPQFFEGNDSGGYGEGGGSTSDNGGGGGGGGVGGFGRAGPEGAIDSSYGGQLSDTSYGGPGPGRSVGEMNANDAVNAARAETQNLSVEALDAKLAATLENAIQAGVVSPNTTVSTPATSTPATSTPSSTTAVSTSTTTNSVSPSTPASSTKADISENPDPATREAEDQALENALGMVANNPATTVASPPGGVKSGDSDPSMLGGDPGVSPSLGADPGLGGPSTSEPGGTGGSGDYTVIPTAEVVSPSTTTTTTPTTSGTTPISYAVDNFLSNLGKTTMVQAPNVYTPFPVTQGIGSFKPYNVSIPLPTFSKVPGQL